MTKTLYMYVRIWCNWNLCTFVFKSNFTIMHNV